MSHAARGVEPRSLTWAPLQDVASVSRSAPFLPPQWAPVLHSLPHQGLLCPSAFAHLTPLSRVLLPAFSNCLLPAGTCPSYLALVSHGPGPQRSGLWKDRLSEGAPCEWWGAPAEAPTDLEWLCGCDCAALTGGSWLQVYPHVPVSVSHGVRKGDWE